MAWDFDDLAGYLDSGNELLESANKTVDGVQALQTNLGGTQAVVSAAAPVADSAAKSGSTEENLEPADASFFSRIAATVGLPVWAVFTILGCVFLLGIALVLKKFMK